MPVKKAAPVQYPVRGGMIRDVARHLISDGVYDASEVILDLDGKVRKRGGTFPYQGLAQQQFPDQLAGYSSGQIDRQASMIGLSHHGFDSGLMAHLYALDGRTSRSGALGTGGIDVIGRPFKYGEHVLFPLQIPTGTPSLNFAVYGGGSGYNWAALNNNVITAASVVVTAASNIVTALAADVANFTPGDYISAGTAALNYVGRVTRILTATTIEVSPIPTIGLAPPTTANAHTVMTLGSTLGSNQGCRTACSFQNRIVAGNYVHFNGTISDYRPSGIIWSVLPGDTAQPFAVNNDGFMQPRAGFLPLNFVQVADVPTIVALVPIGPSQLLILGTDRMARLTGNLVNVTTPGQSIPIDIQPISTSVGCLSDRSVAPTPVGAVWAARDGIYRYDGVQLQNLMQNRVQTLWDKMQRTAGFKIYGSAIIRGDHYVISTNAPEGGLKVDLRTGHWSRYLGPPFSGSTVAPLAPTSLFAAKWTDSTLTTAPTASRDQVFRLDTIVAPAATNSRDHDGNPVQCSVTTPSRSPHGIDARQRIRHVLANVDIKSAAQQPDGNILGVGVGAEEELYLPNQDAEFGNIDNWRPFANTAATVPTVTADSTVKRTGNYSIKFVTVAGTGDNDGVVYDLPGGRSDGNTIYSVEVWVNNSTVGTVTLTVNGVTATTTTVGSWVQLQVSTRIASGDVIGQQVKITHSAVSSTVNIDDLHVAVLQPVQDRDGAILLGNGSLVHRDTQNACTGLAGYKVVCDGGATNEGIVYFARGTFRVNVAYTFNVWAKSISGATAAELAAGVSGNTTTGAITLTTSYKKFSLTWTPTADRTNPEFVVRIPAASAATFAADDFAVTGADPTLDIGMIGGIEAEGDWSDGSADDTTFANYTQDYLELAGIGTLSVSGGQLVPSDITLKSLRYKRGLPGPGVVSRDGEVVVGYQPNNAGDRVSCLIDVTDANNYLMFEGIAAGGSSSIRKNVANVLTVLGPTIAQPTLVLGVDYWLRAFRQGNYLRMEHWTTDPRLGGSGTLILDYTLSAADAAIFASPLYFGIRLTPGSTAMRINDFYCLPYDNVTRVAAGQDQPGLVRGDSLLQSEGATVTYRQYGEASECELFDLRIFANPLNPIRTR